MAQIRSAVVGLGRIGSSLENDSLREKPCTHAGAIQDNPDCTLVGGCDIDPEKREAFSRQWNGCPAFQGIEDLITATRPDILHIATHPDSHYRMVREAMRRGIRVVVCEKPLADTLENARRLAALGRRPGFTVIVNHERRYSEDYREARRRVANREFGELRSIRGTLYFGMSTRLWPMLLHDGTHMLDTMNYLTGRYITSLRARGNLARNGTGYITGRYGSAEGLLEIGSGRDHLVFEIEMSFSSGRVTVGNGVYRECRSIESRYYENYRSLETVRENQFERTGYFSNMVADAVACLNDPGRRPESSGDDALAVSRTIFRVRPFRFLLSQ